MIALLVLEEIVLILILLATCQLFCFNECDHAGDFIDIQKSNYNVSTTTQDRIIDDSIHRDINRRSGNIFSRNYSMAVRGKHKKIAQRM